MLKTSINIVPIPVLQDNYVWTIIDTTQKQAIIVDPGVALPVANFLTKHQFTLAAILITHHHWDHTNGIIELVNRYTAPVFGPKQEKISGVSIPITEHDEINIPNFPMTFQAMHIPGHTLGHIAFYTPSILFCGDTLFAAGCGRIFEGTPQQMYLSLNKIAALPHETKIYCAHEYTLNNLRFAQVVEPHNIKIAERIRHIEMLRKNNEPSLPSTLKEEKETNPFLRCDSPEIIAEVEKHFGQSLHDPVSVFAHLREWKNHFS